MNAESSNLGSPRGCFSRQPSRLAGSVAATFYPCSMDGNTESEPTQQTRPEGLDPKTGKPHEPVEIPAEAQHVGPALAPRGEHAAAKGLGGSSKPRAVAVRDTPRDARGVHDPRPG